MKQLSNVNAAGVATLYRDETIVGTCADTPNAIACCIGNGKGTSAKHFDGSEVKLELDRTVAKGWMTLKSAVYTSRSN